MFYWRYVLLSIALVSVRQIARWTISIHERGVESAMFAWWRVGMLVLNGTHVLFRRAEYLSVVLEFGVEGCLRNPAPASGLLAFGGEVSGPCYCLGFRRLSQWLSRCGKSARFKSTAGPLSPLFVP